MHYEDFLILYNFESDEEKIKYYYFLIQIKVRKVIINTKLNNNAVFIYYDDKIHFVQLLFLNIIILGIEWSHTIVCCKKNYEYVKKCCDELSENINIIVVEINENYLLNETFWKKINGENILLYDENIYFIQKMNVNFFDYSIINSNHIIFLKQNILKNILKQVKINGDLKKNSTIKIFMLFLNKIINTLKINNVLKDNNLFYSDVYNDEIFCCNEIWKLYNYESLINSIIQIKNNNKEYNNNNNNNNVEIILINGNLNNTIFESYNVYINIREVIYKKNAFYLFIDGDYEITKNDIENMKKQMVNCYCNMLSPMIISNENKLEYFGGILNDENFIYINNDIISLEKIEKNNYWSKFVQNTMIPYFNLCMIKNVDNILCHKINKNYMIHYALLLKEIKVSPFIKIKIKNIDKSIKNCSMDKIKNKNGLKFDVDYLKEIYNTYDKNNLVSFKFFDDNYYLGLSNKKYILVIEYFKFAPDNDCGSLYIYYLMDTLLNLGYQVHFYNIINDSKYNEMLQRKGIYVYDSNLKIGNIINNYNVYEYIFISRVYSMNTLYEDIKKYCKKSKIIFVTHDLNLLKNKKQKMLGLNTAYDPSGEDELKYINLSDISLIVSKYEYEYLINENIKKIHYAPICLKIEENYERNIKDTKDIYFIGSGYKANVDALNNFISNQWQHIMERIPNIKLHVIGKVAFNIKPEYRRYNSIILHNYIPEEEINNLLKQFRINIVPLRYGGGIKGKILQSFNLKIPCIASNIAVEGMEIINGENIIVEFFDNNFPEKFTKYYNDIELLQKISNNGYETIKNFYSLEQNNKYMHDMFLQLNDLCK